jgi:catechol 2,3-dioxygenase-like lactoylglutathione lyase family enzyme
MDWKLELVVVPVSDVDGAKAFYTGRVGFNLDWDRAGDGGFRMVQMTPPGGPACSIAVGTGITDAAPGSVRGLHLVVPDIEAARAELAGRGVEVTNARHQTLAGWAPGPDPEHGDYNSIAEFSDPDGNTWILQERGHEARA